MPPSRKSTVTRTKTRERSVSSTSTTTVTAMPVMEFAVNERVLCYHGPLIYEAKVLKVENFGESNSPSGRIGPHFFVHYKGWKQTFVP